MQEDIKNIIENDIKLDENLVWVLADNKQFHYSEGRSSENYLKKVLLKAHDLSSNSYELEQWIKDWPSEYHLTRKRAQLLRGFNFKKTKKVLEVGCGCGAITRFLGETFDNVVAIEGSLARARLAHLRTKDMDSVSIICAPFQEIKFKEQFDLIFCIGVFEYSSMYVDSTDPFNFILNYFNGLLADDGEVVIAIENQFGIKYFSSSREDHSNIMFDGLEGYLRYPSKERTFGYVELKEYLSRHFQDINYYFPYPDYKTPSCILSERFLNKVNAAELIGSFKPSGYLDCPKPLFDERLVLLELEKNNILPFFSNSFLVIAGKQNVSSSKLKYLGVAYSNHRVEQFASITSFIEDETGNILVEKTTANGQDRVESEYVNFQRCKNIWVEGLSLHAQIMKRAKEKDITIEEMFSPGKKWVIKLKALSTQNDDMFLLDGKYIDCIWSNSFLVNGECVFIDLEWKWHEGINIKVLLIRSLFHFFYDISTMGDINSVLKLSSRKRLIKKIANTYGFLIENNDFREFCKLEARLDQVVFGNNYIRGWLLINLHLWNKSIFSFILFNVEIFKKLKRKVYDVILKFGLI